MIFSRSHSDLARPFGSNGKRGRSLTLMLVLLLVGVGLALWVVATIGLLGPVDNEARYFALLKERGSPLNAKPVEVRPDFSGPTWGGTPVLRIPKGYLRVPGGFSEGQFIGVRLETLLPDLEPRPAQLSTASPLEHVEAQEVQRYNRNGLQLVLHNGISGSKRPWRPYDYVRSDADLISTNALGLERYRSPKAKEELADGGPSPRPQVKEYHDPVTNSQQTYLVRPRSRDHFVSPPDVDPWILIDCIPCALYDADRCLCQGRSVHHGWLFEYSIYGSQLTRWREFDGAARTLIDRFAISRPATQISTSRGPGEAAAPSRR